MADCLAANPSDALLSPRPTSRHSHLNALEVTTMQVNIHEAQSQLAHLIQLTLEGNEVVISRNNQPVVKLLALVQPRAKRKLGALQGLVKSISPDFNAPLADFEEYMA
jgi:antitoxin (DNA-binding transcriptional repressor) of toxin-antitoxin stability system